MRAAPIAHFAGELVAVGVVVAIDTTLRFQLEPVVRSFPLVTARARDRLMLAIERELGPAVLLDTKRSRPEPVFVVAGLAVGASKAPAVHIFVAVPALIELETAISALHRQLGRMAASARDVLMPAFEGKRSERMRAKPDPGGQPRPANAGMAVLASISEFRFVNLRMAGYARRARAWGRGVAFVVTGLALRFRMPAGEAETRMVAPDVGDLAPVGFVVARRAFSPRKSALVGILVAGHTVGLQPEKRRLTATVAAIVTVLTSNRGMSPLERPAR